MPTAKKHVTDYTPDPGNANLGTERGGYMLEESLRQVGAGRSIVVDKNGIVIAGNKTLQGAVDSGIVDVVEVETQGDELVVVRRADLDLSDPDGRARLMAYFDNRASEVGLEWDTEKIIRDLSEGLDLSPMFWDDEIADMLQDSIAVYGEECVRDISSDAFAKMHHSARQNYLLNFGDIMATVPADVYERVRAFVMAPEFSSVQEGIVALFNQGLGEC